MCDNPACTSGTNRTLEEDGFVGGYSSVAIGADGNPVISHLDGELRFGVVRVRQPGLHVWHQPHA